ncbi:pathogenesis-related protein PRB1-2-like [Oryza brachyantha]|uniref:SCP domain-containing protein n=1 Tax=Oryza brachyantha TaxID=4533 RepID=J3MIC1_ORYBR|nr:pathogenesis-related protein PRB1-2-like [Oryza brachyantha]
MEASNKAAGFAMVMAMAVSAMMVTTSMAQNSAKDFVDLHNAARAAVGVGPVTWDAKVAEYAAGYARQRAGDCKMVHSGGKNGAYGENLWWGSAGRAWTAADAVTKSDFAWVKEKQWYHHAGNRCSAPAGKTCYHYTQVVWRRSTAIGCARVVCNGNLGVFIICNYSPAGNIRGQSPY